jgi:hypothetical protein
MSSSQETIPSGWIGGFEESNPSFKYPKPDLSSLPMLDNMANIPKLQRQMKALWPEFSWLTDITDESSRCFQMFAPDISRIGYTDEGRVYSIICPQQGAYLNSVGINLNVEVTVTGQRGWVNEPTKELAADLTVTGKIWFSPNNTHPLLRLLFNAGGSLNLPFTKASAIEVQTSNIGNSNPIFPLLKGQTSRFTSPPFALHNNEAYTVGSIDVQINNFKLTDNDTVNKFNQSVLGIFNILSGNMLLNTNVLSWNVWFDSPSLVDQTEWFNHAKLWRESLNVDHRSPDGDGTQARYFNGDFLKINKIKVLEQLVKLLRQVIIPNYKEFGITKSDLLQVAKSTANDVRLALEEMILEKM